MLCCTKNNVSKPCLLGTIAKVLLIVGGLNWGLVGLGMLAGRSWNLVSWIFGTLPALESLIYIIVGIAAVVLIFTCCCRKNCPAIKNENKTFENNSEVM